MINQIKFFHCHKVNLINIRRSLLTTHDKNQCEANARECFKTCRGWQQHQRSCKENQVAQSNLTILSLKSITFMTDTCDNTWNENITFIEGKIDC